MNGRGACRSGAGGGGIAPGSGSRPLATPSRQSNNQLFFFFFFLLNGSEENPTNVQEEMVKNPRTG